MRHAFAPLAAALLLLAPGLAAAQSGPRIEKVRIGFRPYNEALNFGRYKVGLWTPVYVEVSAGVKGLEGGGRAFLEVTTPDFEGVGTIYRVPVVLGPNETGVFVAYTKPGTSDGDLKVELRVGNRTHHAPPERFFPMEVQGSIYLTLGRRVADLPAALRPKHADNKKDDDVQFQDDGRRRAALFEDNAALLPAHWYGYDGVDVVFLSADNAEFLTRLAGQNHVDQLKALAQWVRRGGRLVIPMSKQTQELVSNLMSRPAWQPPVPVVPPARTGDKFVQPERLADVERWGEVNLPLPAPGEKAPSVAQLEPAGVAPGAWDVEARVGNDGVPLIARVKYGLGQIVYFAFSLDDPAFAQWPARQDFLRKAVLKLAPRSSFDANAQQNPNQGFRHGGATDITAQLYNALDNFDVRVIPFGVVAIFILLYVIVVGPLEFVVLKYVLGRLEWTWFTFPAVVLGISIIAYFGAYALKGQDLKINQVDVVDIDQRTDAGAAAGAAGQGQPRGVRVYGQSFVTILSPRIQSYTVGLEPNPRFWGEAAPAKPFSADVVSWMARPDDGPGGMARSGGQGFFRKPYYYGTGDPAEETLPDGVSGVPIPVWMAKAFAASWEVTAAAPPLTADLVYHRHPVEGKDVKVSGTLRSNFAVDLVDAWLFYADKCYPLPNGLPSGKDGKVVKLSLEANQAKLPREWSSEVALNMSRPSTSQGMYDPTGIVKQLLFQEQLDPTRALANHSYRRLDLSWRLYDEPPRGLVDRRTREAILVARVPLRTGPAQNIIADPGAPLPTLLWLGDLPESGRERPGLAGTMNQDTVVRILLPVRPAGN